ncbi:MAG: MBL fold metallo-hydrolase, partial [Bacteroidota bacterium]
LTFWGAAQTVTGSKHLLQLRDGRTLLLDCGLYQGRRAEADQLNRQFGFDASQVDVVLLSHAHIDHAGLLPKLWKEGFRGKIYATHATVSLCGLMLMDSAHIQEKDLRFVNKRRRRKGEPPVEPLYTADHTEGVLGHFIGVPYNQPFAPLDGVEVIYRDAGHILGSATMVLTVKEDGRTLKVGFTGDVGNPGRPILRDPQPMDDCDVLITESTYGGKTHEPPDQSKARLRDIIQRTSQRGGKVIIPAFAVGRTQEIVHTLDHLWNEHSLPPIPVYVDSPMAVNATGIYLAHPECYDRELRDYLVDDPNPFGWERLEYIRRTEDSKALNGQQVPMVVISASGMCEAGRILHHLRNNIEDARTTILMVGYCADHTLGKRLIEQRPEIKIYGETYTRRANVEVMNSYSAHADEPGLIEFLDHVDRDRLQRTFLVHGAPERQALLKAALDERGYRQVTIPAHGESFEL